MPLLLLPLTPLPLQATKITNVKNLYLFPRLHQNAHRFLLQNLLTKVCPFCRSSSVTYSPSSSYPRAHFNYDPPHQLHVPLLHHYTSTSFPHTRVHECAHVTYYDGITPSTPARCTRPPTFLHASFGSTMQRSRAPQRTQATPVQPRRLH